MANIKKCDDGEVVLIAGGGKCYTDVAARFCHSNRSLDDILTSSYDAKLVRNILDSGHLAATEFDYFLFGITGFARVTEIQLVRKRLASYLISSGRDDRSGKRSYDVVMPDNIMNVHTKFAVDPSNIMIDSNLTDPLSHYISLSQKCPDIANSNAYINFGTKDILGLLESWYNEGVENGVPEEDLRYMKPQATEFKAIIGFNCHALLDWFAIRCCNNAQHEIRSLACKMMVLCKEAQPDLFKDAGPNCVRLGYCPENSRQCEEMKGKVLTKREALEVLNKYKNKELIDA